MQRIADPDRRARQDEVISTVRSWALDRQSAGGSSVGGTRPMLGAARHVVEGGGVPSEPPRSLPSAIGTT